jgi:hypothetical protein
MEWLSKILITGIFFFGIYIIYSSRSNYSLILICIFLSLNIFIEANNSKITIMKGMFCGKKRLVKHGILKSRNIVVMEDIQGSKILRHLSYDRFLIIAVIDSNMNVLGMMTEIQVIEGLAKLGTCANVGDIFNLH